MIRRQLNRVVVVGGLLVLLPLIVVAERVRPGAGRRVARAGVGAVARLCGVVFVVEGGQRLSGGASYVFVPNHSSPIDIPAMVTARPGVRFAAAADLSRFPLLASVMRTMDAVLIDRHHPRAARRQLSAVAAEGGALELTVFAEGGIAPRGTRLPFKAGAFAVAIEAGAAVVPVAIEGADRVLPPGARLGVRPGVVRVRLLEALPTEGLTLGDRHQLRDRAERAVHAALDAA